MTCMDMTIVTILHPDYHSNYGSLIETLLVTNSVLMGLMGMINGMIFGINGINGMINGINVVINDYIWIIISDS